MAMLFQNALSGIGQGFQNMMQSFREGLQGPDDPNAIDPTYNMPAGDVHAARLAGLQRMGMLLTAAGAARGNERARILAQIADATDPTRTLYTNAQARLMNMQVQEAQNKIQRRRDTLERLSKMDISGIATPREEALFRMYLEAGDPEGALEVLSRAQATADAPIALSDGSTISKGVALENRRDFNKNFAPVLRDADTKLNMALEIYSAVDGGLFSGSLAEQKLAAAKLLESFGVDTGLRDKILNSENVQAAVLPVMLQRMQELGGNDSNEELKRIEKGVASLVNEPETLKRNMTRLMRTIIEEAAVANAQAQRLTKNGQAEYGLYVEFDPELIPSPYMRDVYETFVVPEYERVYGGPAERRGLGAGNARSNQPLVQIDDESLEYTAQQYGMTKEQVLEILRSSGAGQ